MAAVRGIGVNLPSKKGITELIYQGTRSFIPLAKRFYLNSFDREGYTPSGFIRWKSLKESTKKWRERKGFPHPTFPMLVNTGKLKQSIQFRAMKQAGSVGGKLVDKGLVIYTLLDYAEINNKTRPFIYESEKLNQEYADYLAKYIASRI